jgi:telomerase reverse transcriptase
LNKYIIHAVVKTFISGRRFDAFSLHHFIQGIKTSQIPWLYSQKHDAAASERHITPNNAEKARELLSEFVFWYTDSFVLPLLKTTFYITESSAFRNRVLYFRQDDWLALCKPLLERLTGTGQTFRRLEVGDAEEMLRQRKLGFSFVRLLPKETGVRPIVNLRRRKAGQDVRVLFFPHL